MTSEPATSDPAPTAAQTTAIAKEVLSWADFGDASRALAQQIADSGFEPEIVIAIARGGLTVGGAIAYALGVKSCGAINVELYTGIDETLPEPLVLPPLLDGSALAGKRVLLADDVSQSGQTLKLAVEIIEGMGAEVRSVTLYTKPQTIFVPDYAWRDTDLWITFPWSAQPPVTAAARPAGA
ncbi:phosphoribosyltransferase [Herbiconiux sp. L3-i23]|uniref:phosphoribosyltransferase n=1 Tax=Herbiconiux sp. L3-i23 TaxID=2905871 RepID=UPI002054687D|nr:phosphoribosyltransferase [Herbiconiux sp. L3-i23]BDI23285.1 phosphoribosyltransferase [Herbiconiux sp. L3-i23]